MPTYFQETPNYRSNYKYRNTNDNNNYSLKSSSIDMNSNNVINNIKNNRCISKKFHNDFKAEELLEECGMSVEKLVKVIEDYLQ